MREGHRNIVQLHHVFTSRPYEALKAAAMPYPEVFSRVDWNSHTRFLVTDFVPWCLKDALEFRLYERRRRATSPTADRADVACEEFGWVISVVSDVAEALLHLWQLRILHMDVCTKNIMVAPYGNCDSAVKGSKAHAVLVDFGSAVTLAADSLTAPLRDCTGNRAHLAPELLGLCADLRHGDGTADAGPDLSKQPVFELGILAYEVMLAGRHPLPGHADSRLVWQDGDLPQPPADFPLEFGDLLPQCVRYAAEERPSLQEVVDKLRYLRVQAGLKPAYKLAPRPSCLSEHAPSVWEVVAHREALLPGREAMPASPAVACNSFEDGAGSAGSGGAPFCPSGVTLDCVEVLDALRARDVDKPVQEAACDKVERLHGDCIDVVSLPRVLLDAGATAVDTAHVVLGVLKVARTCARPGGWRALRVGHRIVAYVRSTFVRFSNHLCTSAGHGGRTLLRSCCTPAFSPPFHRGRCALFGCWRRWRVRVFLCVLLRRLRAGCFFRQVSPPG
jgi:hypothetical protein